MTMGRVMVQKVSQFVRMYKLFLLSRKRLRATGSGFGAGASDMEHGKRGRKRLRATGSGFGAGASDMEHGNVAGSGFMRHLCGRQRLSRGWRVATWPHAAWPGATGAQKPLAA